MQNQSIRLWHRFTLLILFLCWSLSGIAEEYIVQPGPDNSQDIWTTSYYSYADCAGPGVGGGKNDEKLRVGGWGDAYFSLMQFDLAGLPAHCSSAFLYVFCFNLSGGGTEILLDRITSPWNWKISGTGCDRDRLWWADKPSADLWRNDPLTTPTQGGWYAIDITDLYNGWGNGGYANYGLQLRPVSTSDNNFDEFYSADYTVDPNLRPKLVVTSSDALGAQILKNPENQFALIGETVTMNVVASGAQPLNYQWFFNNTPIIGGTNASVVVGERGNYSVTVSNLYGVVRSSQARLEIVGIDTSLQCLLMTVNPLPAKQLDKNNLILITHGWQPGLTQPANPQWVSDMADALRAALNAGGVTDWQVVPYFWVKDAWTFPGNLITLEHSVLGNADKIGKQIGNQIAEQGWQHVHLIAHSAGATLIQSAADAIHVNAPGITTHTTFLDPFVGLDYRGLDWYGENSSWSDNYFCHDLTVSFTEGVLVNSHNVDVGWLDPDATSSSTRSGLPVIGTTTETFTAYSSHDWPHNFYQRTITNTDSTWCGVGLGFSLSKEAAGDNRWPSLSPNNSPEEPCGHPPIVQQPLPIRIDQFFDINEMPAFDQAHANMFGKWFVLGGQSVISPQFESQFGRAQSENDGPNETTNEPAWLAFGFNVTNVINLIQFDAAFTDTNSAIGLLTIYWNTNQIGSVDERFASTNRQTYRFSLPQPVSDGIYMLGFRLDSFSNATSIVTVTNISTGFSGIDKPITLSISIEDGGIPALRLTAPPGYNYLLQTSTNLTTWTAAALLVNTNGTVLFSDFSYTNDSVRFYQATSY